MSSGSAKVWLNSSFDPEISIKMRVKSSMTSKNREIDTISHNEEN